MRIIIFIFILNTLYSVSFAQSEHPSIICQYGGALAKELQGTDFTFSIDEIPKRCDVICYGANYFNEQPEEEDANAIKELKKAGKTVYMFYMYRENVDWPCIISSTNETVLDDHIAPMLTFLKENNVDGVVLAYLDLFSGQIPDYTTKISRLFSKIKKCVPNLKIAVIVGSFDPIDFGNKELFDFTAVNSLVDMYIIDASLKNLCDNSTIAANGGRLPIKPADADDTRFNLDNACTNASASMDKNKLYIELHSVASKMLPDHKDDYLSYSEYCAGPVSETDVYCVDTMQQFYDTATYAKKYFTGLFIYGVNFDDFDNSCSCGYFPVANTYMDAWTGQPLKCCDKIG